MAISEKISTIFDFLPESNILEEYFYNHVGDYPVYSGQTEKQGIVAKIDTYEHELPCVTFTTYGVGAGKMFYREGKYTIGRNCMGLRPKQEYKEMIDLEWFAFSFQSLFYRYRIGDPQGQRSLNKLLLERVVVTVPEINAQKRQLEKYNRLLTLKRHINNIVTELSQTTNICKKFPEDMIIGKDNIKTFFNIVGGNSGLTEEFIYHNLPENDEDKIEILTGATLERTAMGFVSKNAKPDNRRLKVFEGPAVLIARKGYAGTMTYIPKGRFTTNDDAYIMTPKNEWKRKINLEWFRNEYQELFWRIVTSRSDNATFSKEYIERQTVLLPQIDEQNRIVKKVAPVITLIRNMQKTENKIDNVLEYSIF
jgi:restriction endonuclease S subunit